MKSSYRLDRVVRSEPYTSWKREPQGRFRAEDIHFPEKKMDPFTESVLKRIDPGVRETLSATQLAAIASAIGGCRPPGKHPLDIRGVIPLFFARYYFVVLMGRDRRRRTQAIESDRRRQGSFTGGLSMMALILVFLLSPAAVATLYFLKTIAGINIFPDKHAWEVISELLK